MRGGAAEMLTELEELVLDLLCERRYVYAHRVAQDARIPLEQAERVLEQLADLGYVKRLSGWYGRRYRITQEGREATVRPNPEVWTA